MRPKRLRKRTRTFRMGRIRQALPAARYVRACSGSVLLSLHPRVVVLMGSACKAGEETVDYLMGIRLP